MDGGSVMTVRRVGLVTGASGGIGRAIAERLAAEGFDLTISARKSGPLDVAAVRLRRLGGRVESVSADMGDEDQVLALAESHVQTHGRLDVLVMAAGTGSAGGWETYPRRLLDAQISVNLRGPFVLVQRLLSTLRASAAAWPDLGAKIIAIASLTGVVSEPDLAAYGATKAALISLCESLTLAEGANGVLATALSPGYVDTDMTEWVRDRIDPSMMIKTTDVAELVVALCRLSRNAAVPNVVLTRPGERLWRA